MKKSLIIVTLISLVTITLNCQEIIEKKYIKNKYGGPSVSEKKAKYVEITYKEIDGTLKYEIRDIKTNNLIKVKAYKDKVSCGVWTDYNELGELTRILDYDFEIIYNDKVYENVVQYDIISNSLKEKIDGEFENPQFLEYDNNFRMYIAKNLLYPSYAAEDGIQGKVFSQFIIDDKGNVVDVSIYKSAHKILDKEAMRVIRQSPKWKPAKLNGAPIKVCIIIPIVFVLQ